MSNTLVINSPKYAIYVRVLAGQGGGTLVTVDTQGHIHVGPGAPGPLATKLQASIKQIKAGVEAFNATIAGHKAIAA